MSNSKEYLRSRSCITEGDVVFMDLTDLMTYTKLVQLESVLIFVEDNHPEYHGIINSLKFEIRALIKTNTKEEEDNSLNY